MLSRDMFFFLELCCGQHGLKGVGGWTEAEGLDGQATTARTFIEEDLRGPRLGQKVSGSRASAAFPVLSVVTSSSKVFNCQP